MADQIRVNGNIYSWGSIVVKVDGERFHGFTSISYADKRERAKVYGLGKHQAARGRTRGKYTTEAVKLKGPLETTSALRKALAKQSPDGKSYGDYEFEIVVQYVEDLSNQEPHTDVLEECVYTGTNSAPEEGSDAVSEELECDTMKIKRNGMYLFDASEGKP